MGIMENLAAQFFTDTNNFHVTVLVCNLHSFTFFLYFLFYGVALKKLKTLKTDN